MPTKVVTLLVVTMMACTAGGRPALGSRSPRCPHRYPHQLVSTPADSNASVSLHQLRGGMTARTGWTILFSATGFEMVSTIFMNKAQGFTKPLEAALAVVFYGASFFLFNKSLGKSSHTLPVLPTCHAPILPMRQRMFCHDFASSRARDLRRLRGVERGGDGGARGCRDGLPGREREHCKDARHPQYNCGHHHSLDGWRRRIVVTPFCSHASPSSASSSALARSHLDGWRWRQRAAISFIADIFLFILSLNVFNCIHTYSNI